MGVQGTFSDFASVSTIDRRLSRIRDHQVVLHLAIFSLAFFVLFLRRPDALLNAQFYAEDGKYWYADAYHFGFRCLWMPLDGYLNSVSRLIGLLTLLFPLAYAPLIMNVAGLLGAILPVNIFLSSRFGSIPIALRIFASVWYLLLPNSYEIHANTTNLHWHLALVGCLVLLAKPGGTAAWRVFDCMVLASLALAGPLGILLVPVAVVLRWTSKDQSYNLFLGALIPGAVLQALLILFSGSRPSPTNGATFQQLAGILGGQLFLSSIFGLKEFVRLYYVGNPVLLSFLELVALALGVPVMTYAVLYGPVRLKLFILFSVTVLILGLTHPLVDPSSVVPQWQLLQTPGIGNRYYFFPMVAFFASLIWMLGILTPTPKMARYLAGVILLFVPFGIYTDRQYFRFKDLHFRAFAAQFEQASPGTRVTIPVYPGTGPWQMELAKK